MEKRKLNVAVAGCGVIGSAHCEAVNANYERVNLYAVCDSDEDRATKFAEKYKAYKYYTDFEKMLEDRNVDLVCICTPSGMHVDMALDCAKAGKHVLCEKPIGITKEQLDQLSIAFTGTSLKFGTVFQYRTYPGLLKAKQMLDSGELGKILIGNGHCKIYRSPEYYKSAGWRGTWELDGGGCLMNQAIHTLDVLSWLSGGVESVVAKAYTLARDIEVEDTAFALLKFRNGAYGSFQASTLYMPDLGVNVEIQCEKGRIVFTSDRTYLYTPGEKGRSMETCLDETPGNNSSGNNIGHAYLINDMADAILNDKAPHIPVKEGRHSVDVILSIYESSKTGGEVKV